MAFNSPDGAKILVFLGAGHERYAMNAMPELRLIEFQTATSRQGELRVVGILPIRSIVNTTGYRKSANIN
jgi:hypothetical protein